ncbi:MAG TPA: bifunctional phosphopantothenoylcysteine decarboxylase/phosphopantothenate--cysteine ligase CoaBC, partial [Methanomicrobiales archaeon]|nr:bifunctional phosphopantothenoylcysteine decarboxylase/phosphopantothenate--cysteine ligase CoaBC [Methanomicrobiales archaeon]
RDEEVAARDLLGRGVGVVVINPPETMGAAESEATILTGSGTDRIKGSKEEVAAAVWKALP